MFFDTTMHDEQNNNNNNNKRPIAEISDTDPEVVQQSNKRGARGETETPRVDTTEDMVMSDSETEANGTAGLSGLPGLPGLSGLSGLAWMEMSRPSKHENVVRIAAGTKPAYRAYRPFYVSGLGPGQEKEGLAISAHLDHDAPDSLTWSDEEIAERLAEVREVLGAMLANVDELTARMRAHSGWKENVSRAEVREKLAYMLGATWQRFMGVDFPGSGPGTIQCFSSYYTLAAAHKAGYIARALEEMIFIGKFFQRSTTPESLLAAVLTVIGATDASRSIQDPAREPRGHRHRGLTPLTLSHTPRRVYFN